MSNEVSSIQRLEFELIPGIPMIGEGDALAKILFEAMTNAGQRLVEGDVLVIAQKIVSKAEGRLVPLSSVVPSDAAIVLARETEKEPEVLPSQFPDQAPR